jgi:hypothetical protein
MEIPNIVGKSKTGPKAYLKLIGFSLIALAVIAAASILAYNQLNKDDQSLPPGYVNREQAYDFVSLWGSYNVRSFDQRAEDLKSSMTSEYYQATFDGEAMSQKKRFIGESGTGYVTVPHGSLNEITISNESENGYDALVYAEETMTTQNGENYYDQIVYRLRFVKKDNKFLVNNVTTERASEEPPHSD